MVGLFLIRVVELRLLRKLCWIYCEVREIEFGIEVVEFVVWLFRVSDSFFLSIVIYIYIYM